MSENTPLLNDEEVTAFDPQGVRDEDVVTFVNNRRSSIASSVENTGANISNYTGHTRAGTLHTPTKPLGLALFKSNASLQRGSDLVSVLSNQDLLAEPKTSLAQEITELSKSSIPLIITFLLQYSLTVASVFSVGRLGLTELAAVSLSSMTANISGYAIIQGVATCLDTLCAQSYGRKDYSSVGMHMVRCSYLLLLLWIPIFILWVVFSEPILIAIVGSKEKDLCLLALKYLQILSLGLPGFMIFENAKHYLQCQGIFHASTYVLFFCAPLNALLNYLLVWDPRIGLGFIGAPLSVVITDWVMCILILVYIFAIDGWQCWPKEGIFNKKCFTHWQKMIDLSLPGVIMVEAEWLAFEVITFTASKFGTEVLAAQSVISTTCVLFYQIPFAFSIAASTRVAWYIGAASHESAVVTSNAAIYASLGIGIINGLFIFIFRDFLARLFTSDEKVLDLAGKILIIGAAYQVNDSLSCSTNGILRGQGRQKIGGILNLLLYYLVALPLAFLFAFHFKLELYGLWLGMIIALILVSLSQTYFVYASDWDSIISKSIADAVEDGGISIDTHSLRPTVSRGSIIV